eukprot:GILI01008491.1.p1 GENE.GILI01008491.1~~GILI01008491.1.p1  ORF type:complete len:277 (-),score=64.13 GILI01008491.1:245-1033(-)
MTCPVTFVCKNWKYIALGAAVIIGAKIALSGSCCGKKDSPPCGNPACKCGPDCKCGPNCQCGLNTSSTKRPLDAVVFSGPSGVGKGTLINKIRDMHPASFAFSVSHTTRDIRENETDGVQYHFITKEEIQKKIDNGDFLEACNVHGNIYGTSKKALQDVRDSGKVAIIEMDVQGAQKLKTKQGDLHFYYIFISADEVELEKRLVKRGTDNAERIKTRMETARQENKFVAENPNFYDKVVENDNVQRTADEILALLRQQGAKF